MTPKKMYRFRFDYSKPRYWLRRDHLLQFNFCRGAAGVWSLTLGPFRLMRIRKFASVRDFMNESWDEISADIKRDGWLVEVKP